MELVNSLKLTAALVLVIAAIGFVGASGNKVAAHETPQGEANTVYSYTAQSGDSYSEMARKAVQTYGLKHKINLSQAGIIYAETNLTLAAGSPILNEGQNVELKESDIHGWVDKARDLSDTAEAAWNRYVASVDFNTDNVGQSR